MLATRFNLIYKGEVHNGYDLEEVKATIAELFDLDEKGLEQFFSGRPVALKEHLDAVTGETFQKALACVGAVTHLEPVQCEATEELPGDRRRRQRRRWGDRRATYRGSSIQPDRRIRDRRAPH